jgi:hypothetical protein
VADLSVDSHLGGSVGTTVGGTLNSVVSGAFGAVGPVTLAGIPDDYTIGIDELPKIEIGVDPLQGTLTLNPVTLNIAPVQVEAGISLREVPSVRVHLPANYAIALSLFGVEIAALRLCGEGQVITEPYRPNPCEPCGRPELAQADLSLLRE